MFIIYNVAKKFFFRPYKLNILYHNSLKATKRRAEEQEVPGGTQTGAMKEAYGGADRGKSHGGGRADYSRGTTNGGGAGGREAQG